LAESKVIHLPVSHSISLWTKVRLGWTKKMITSPWRGLLARPGSPGVYSILMMLILKYLEVSTIIHLILDCGTIQRVCERKVRSIGLRDDTKNR
jgi:hypothetical protein